MFKTLTVGIDTGATPPVLILSGSLIAQLDGDIRTVFTEQLLCANTVTPASCPGGVTAQTGNMTQTNFTPILVLTGQQVQINVLISFS